MSTPNNSEKEIYFHVGTGKTGSTFLQDRVFPKFKGIYYIHRSYYKKHAVDIITKGEHSRYFISCEFDRQMEEEVRYFSNTFPNTKPIIVFRRHDSYIASQYRRIVKNGFQENFKSFFNIDDDSGYFKKHDLDYTRQIKLLEECFDQKPLVLLFDDLKQDSTKFVNDFAKDLKVDIDTNKIDFTKKHTSYNEKQLKAIHALAKKIDIRKRRVFKNGFLNIFARIYLAVVRYSTLHFAKLIPNKFFSDEPIMSKEELKEVKEYYEKDWEYCLEYAKNQTRIAK
ncbi:MAG: hypothetical protein GY827_11585 [Cytophagales bacterium]|nr:hypothetical protein [Cytophagales bacterium]